MLNFCLSQPGSCLAGLKSKHLGWLGYLAKKQHSVTCGYVLWIYFVNSIDQLFETKIAEIASILDKYAPVKDN